MLQNKRYLHLPRCVLLEVNELLHYEYKKLATPNLEDEFRGKILSHSKHFWTKRCRSIRYSFFHKERESYGQQDTYFAD